MTLFFKECKTVLKSLPNFIYILVLCFFFAVSYIGDIQINIRGNESQASYYIPPHDGDISSWEEFRLPFGEHPYGAFWKVPAGNHNSATAMGFGLHELLSEFLLNEYMDMTVSQNHKNLSDKKQAQIFDVLVELCGIDFINEVMNNPTLHEAVQSGGNPFPNLTEFINDTTFDISVDDYYRLRWQAGKIIGGQNRYNSIYGPFFPYNDLTVVATFEEALEAYNIEILDKYFTQDAVSGGLARVFARYMSTVALLLGGIIAAFYLVRDPKHHEVIASKSISSLRLFVTKYIAVNAALLIPILILALAATVHAYFIAIEFSAPRFDIFAFFRISIVWVLPTNMFVTALAMLVTTIINTPIISVILFASAWWMQMESLAGAFGLSRLFIHFGSEFSLELYHLVRHEIILNRFFYAGVSIILVCVTVWLFHLKRRGRWSVQNLFRTLSKKH